MLLKPILPGLLLLIFSAALPLAAETSPATAGLIAHWPLIGPIPLNLSANKITGTSSNVVLRPDRFGNEYGTSYFNGTNSYIDIGTNASPPLPITMAGWIKTQLGLSAAGYVFRNDQDYSDEVPRRSLVEG